MFFDAEKARSSLPPVGRSRTTALSHCTRATFLERGTTPTARDFSGYLVKWTFLPIGPSRSCFVRNLEGISPLPDRILSYINNLRPDRYTDLYHSIESIIEAAIPLWEISIAGINTGIPYGGAPSFRRIPYPRVEYKPEFESIPESDFPPKTQEKETILIIGGKLTGGRTIAPSSFQSLLFLSTLRDLNWLTLTLLI